MKQPTQRMKRVLDRKRNGTFDWDGNIFSNYGEFDRNGHAFSCYFDGPLVQLNTESGLDLYISWEGE